MVNVKVFEILQVCCIHGSSRTGPSETSREDTMAIQPLPRLIANTRLQHRRLCSVLLTNMFLTRCHFGAGVMYGTNQPKCRLPEKYLVTFVAPPLRIWQNCDSRTGLFWWLPKLLLRHLLLYLENWECLIILIWKNCDYFDCYSNRGTVWANFWIHRN